MFKLMVGKNSGPYPMTKGKWNREFKNFRIWECQAWDEREGCWMFGCKVYLKPPVVKKAVVFWNTGYYPTGLFPPDAGGPPKAIISQVRSIMRRSVYKSIRRRKTDG